MTFNTGNPVGSTDARDLYDNATNLDKFANGPDLEYPDRLGMPRKSLAGLRQDVQDALSRLGYQVIGDYAAGLVVENFGQVFRKDGELWRATASLALPYTLTGVWASESVSFVSVGDAVLRGELVSAGGASLIGYGTETVQWALEKVVGVSPTVTRDFGGVGDGVADDTAAVTAALESGRTVTFDGVFKVGPISISGKVIDARFAPGAKLVFSHTDQGSLVFDSCKGRVDDFEIDDVMDAVGAGTTFTIRAQHCENFKLRHGRINHGKDMSILLFECSDTWVEDTVVTASASTRPFACESIGSKNSGFVRCGMSYTQFGFVLIGPGYKSGGDFITTKDYKETLGQKVIDCWVYDHTGHAFDINGAVGAEVRGCTAIKYTGTSSGHPAFQMKNSTNIPEEISGDTRFNWIRDCVAVDQVSGFVAQDASNGVFENNVAINCKRYALALNKCPRFRVKGLKVRDWALDLASWPLQNGDTVAAAVNVWEGSSKCVVEDIEVEVTQDHANLNISTIVNVISTEVTVGSVRIEKTIPQKLHSALVIKGTAVNCHILDGFRPGSLGYYTQRPIVDETETTIYPRQFGVVLPLTSAGTSVMPSGPQRAFAAGKIQISSTGGTPSGTFSVGRIGNPAQILGSTSASATEQKLDPSSPFIEPGQVLSASCVTSGGGSVRIMVLGVDML